MTTLLVDAFMHWVISRILVFQKRYYIMRQMKLFIVFLSDEWISHLYILSKQRHFKEQTASIVSIQEEIAGKERGYPERRIPTVAEFQQAPSLQERVSTSVLNYSSQRIQALKILHELQIRQPSRLKTSFKFYVISMEDLEGAYSHGILLVMSGDASDKQNR